MLLIRSMGFIPELGFNSAVGEFSLGSHSVAANAPDMGHSEQPARYRELWRAEESFRITKHELKVRSVVHGKPDRVKALIAIAHMAFACVRHLACRIAPQQR